MNTDSVFLDGSMIKVYSLNTLVIGAGPAGLSAALTLQDAGQKDIALLYDSLEGSTGRLSHSDAQAYYRLADYGAEGDSPMKLARSIASSNNCDGDLAYAEAAHSSRAFYRLTTFGVPFEEDEHGEFSSRNPSRRTLHIGASTASEITRALSEKVRDSQIPVFRSHQLIRLFTDPARERVIGALALNLTQLGEPHQRFVLFNAENVILATGGPGGLFFQEAYPIEHTGCLGLALEAGAHAVNLTELAYGICAVGRSLTMNGAFMAAMPRFISVNDQGQDPQEFLISYFRDRLDRLYELQAKKATEWSFDAKRVRTDGSSLLDLLIYHEVSVKGRHVFMDYRANPTGYATMNLPFERLKALSPSAYEILEKLRIDPSKQAVEVALCAAHLRGGLLVDTHWESNLKHLFPIGECAGTHGTYVPDGASLSSTQVSGYRAATYIASHYRGTPMTTDSFATAIKEDFHETFSRANQFLRQLSESKNTSEEALLSVKYMRVEIGRRMDRCSGVIRDSKKIRDELSLAQDNLKYLMNSLTPSARVDVGFFFKNYDLLICQVAFLWAMLDYEEHGGKSRGSFLIHHENGTLPHPHLPEDYRFAVADAAVAGKVQEIAFHKSTYSCDTKWRPARPIPKRPS